MALASVVLGAPFALLASLVGLCPAYAAICAQFFECGKSKTPIYYSKLKQSVVIFFALLGINLIFCDHDLFNVVRKVGIMHLTLMIHSVTF
jgi:hypothetical protein